jgi:hypothetical protein
MGCHCVYNLAVWGNCARMIIISKNSFKFIFADDGYEIFG